MLFLEWRLVADDAATVLGYWPFCLNEDRATCNLATYNLATCNLNVSDTRYRIHRVTRSRTRWKWIPVRDAVGAWQPTTRTLTLNATKLQRSN